ncbi:hypothetical protein OKA04_19210 [Luteolibacter flavescens]|uniref:Uncharacterized protein n=1 Tax=Luteolibacter flavescens TaxID=1859460 RepID=A0ABT3FTL8_9BACT|nr:hypothetical protein [Luteolibacter flavescens]MCW1886877.1 hypothetical protein [Luteolibacter flavescens]
MNFRRLFLALLLAPALSHAAPSVRVLPWDEEIAQRKLALVSGENVVEITQLHPSKRSPFFQLRGDGPFFVRALDKKAADGTAAQHSFTIGANVTHPLLMLLPDPKDPAGIRAVVFDDNPAGFRWGTYRFLNSTPKEMEVRLEKKAVRVPVGWKPVDLDIGGDNRGFSALFIIPGNTKPLYSAIWEYDKEMRTLCFLVPSEDPRIGPVAVKAIPEDRKSAEDAQPRGAAASTPN